MNELFNGLNNVRAHISDLLIISHGNFEDHLNKVKIVLNKLKAASFNINAEISFFVRYNLDYLGLKITRQGIMPLPDKVQYIAVPTNKKAT